MNKDGLDRLFGGVGNDDSALVVGLIQALFDPDTGSRTLADLLFFVNNCEDLTCDSLFLDVIEAALPYKGSCGEAISNKVNEEDTLGLLGDGLEGEFSLELYNRGLRKFVCVLLRGNETIKVDGSVKLFLFLEVIILRAKLENLVN